MGESQAKDGSLQGQIDNVQNRGGSCMFLILKSKITIQGHSGTDQSDLHHWVTNIDDFFYRRVMLKK